jgi:hypothetical protein
MVAANSFVYLPEDVFAFFKSNTFHEDAGGRALVQVVADENETLASPDNASSFGALGINVRWKLELLDEVNELNLSVFFDHQHFSDCGQGLRVSNLLGLYLD